jgi:hypothetical protein
MQPRRQALPRRRAHDAGTRLKPTMERNYVWVIHRPGVRTTAGMLRVRCGVPISECIHGQLGERSGRW